MKILDLKRLIAAGKKMGAIIVVDNTFATPINQNPLTLGADLVVHSATKFIGGHSDALGGVVCGSADLIQKIYEFREINGATLDANSAYLLIRGLKTLDIRIEKQNKNAMALAKFLLNHDKVEQVFYPGLESDIGHEIAKGLNINIGDKITFNILGRNFEAKVFNTREIKWENMNINFIFILSKSNIEKAPHTLIATTKTKNKIENNNLIEQIVTQFSNISTISIEESYKALKSILNLLQILLVILVRQQ